MPSPHPLAAQVLDTPARPSNIQKTEYSTIDLAARRASVLASVGPSIPQVTIDLFFKYLLPSFPNGPITEEDLEEICEAVLAVHYVDGRWTSFPKDPADSKNENKVFFGLIAIARAVEDVVRMKLALEPTVVLDNNPDRVPESTWRKNKTRPDGYFILRHPQCDEPHWMDVVFPGEYKRKDDASNINDDISKTIWNMHHIMREDPRRVFTFGSTVENRTLRLWYAGRAEVVVSDPFDFISFPKLLIRFFVTVMYAKPDSLGWDPTMKLVRDSQKKFQHEITIFSEDQSKPSVYRTTRLISNVGACALRGRGTRVWEVLRLDDNGEPTGLPMVLKDSWPDTDRPREMEVLNQIFKDLGPEEEIKDYFLTTMVAGDVIIGGTVSRTLSEQERALLQARGDGEAPREFNLRQMDCSDRAIRMRNKLHESLEQELSRSPVCSYSTMQGENEKPVKYSPKTHHRIVFKEVCESLYEQVDLTTILTAIYNICDPLERMHTAGWVHRDISAGNILIMRVNGSVQVKISDLEYAKRYGKAGTTAHEVRTGTQDFMSVEVYKQAYLFGLDEPEPDSPLANYQSECGFGLESVAESKLPLKLDFNGPVPAPTESELSEDPAEPLPISDRLFSYNPLHDLESTWWTTAFFVINKDVEFIPTSEGIKLPVSLTEPSIYRSGRLKKQADFAKSLFLVGQDRESMFTAGHRVRSRLLECLHPALRQVGRSLNNARAHLVAAYTTAERGTAPIGHEAAQNVYRQLRKELLNSIKETGTSMYRVKVPRSIAQAFYRDKSSSRIANPSGPSNSIKRKPEHNSDAETNAHDGFNGDSDNDAADGVDARRDDSSQVGRKRVRTTK